MLKKKLKTIKILLIVICILSIGFGYYYSRFIAPTDYHVKNYDIKDSTITKTLDNFKIGFISDLNIKSSSDIERLNNIVNTLNGQECDMVIFGGDIFDSDVFDNAKVVTALKNITTNFGKFAVLGEKDLVHLNDINSILVDAGFEVLHNEYRKIYYQEDAISLFGLEANSDLSSLVNEQNQDTFKVVAVHEPDYFEEVSSANMQLQLSGHNLGGYINVPFIGPIFNKSNVSKYTSGKYTKNKAQLIVSNGLGNESDFTYRFNSPHQIITITLKANIE